MTTETGTFWLENFSQQNVWTQNVAKGAIAEVLERTPKFEIEAICKELAINTQQVDPIALTNLLRHWMRLSLDERSALKDPDYAKNMRSKAKQLNKSLDIIDDVLGTHRRSGLSYPISQHLNAALPVHRADFLLRSLRDFSTELRPATNILAQEKLRRGPRRNDTAIAEIDGLADIFEYLTGAKAARTFDPITDNEEGPFRAFVERCMRMLNDGQDVPVDWAIRQVLQERKI